MTVIESLRKQAKFLMLLGEQGFVSLDQTLRNAVATQFEGDFWMCDFSDSEVIMRPQSKPGEPGLPMEVPQDEYYSAEYAVAEDGTIEFVSDPVKVAKTISYEMVDDSSNETLKAKLSKVFVKIMEISKAGPQVILEYGVAGMKWGVRSSDSAQRDSIATAAMRGRGSAGGRKLIAARIRSMRSNRTPLEKGAPRVTRSFHNKSLNVMKNRASVASAIRALRSKGFSNRAVRDTIPKNGSMNAANRNLR